MNHIEDDAELYAIGALEEPERGTVERHARSCQACAERLAQARENVASVESLRPQFVPSPVLAARLQDTVRPSRAAHFWIGALATAAVFALALIPTWVAVDRERSASRAMGADEAAMAKLAQAPFDHAIFMSPRKQPMAAKVLYGPRGDWYYIVVMNPRPRMQIAYVHRGRMEMLGPVQMHGGSGSLYLPVNHKMEELALLENGHVVGDAHLVY
jgi:hypothetical protein